jgi:hypothetical protein
VFVIVAPDVSWQGTREMRLLAITIVVTLLVLPACSARRGVDLNAATPGQIAALPGMTLADAERVVAHRPYFSTRDLVARGIVDASQYGQLAGRVYVGPPAAPEYLEWVPPQAEGP